MEIIIEGWRAGRAEWQEAESVLFSHLPPLSDEQRSAAKKMGISEEAYARSAFAGKRNQEGLLEKTRRFGEILERTLRARFAGARIERIRLVTIDHEYRMDLSAGERKVLFGVTEDMLDDLVEGGAAEVGRPIERNLETVLSGQAA
jgi:hypothetical protein